MSNYSYYTVRSHLQKTGMGRGISAEILSASLVHQISVAGPDFYRSTRVRDLQPVELFPPRTARV